MGSRMSAFLFNPGGVAGQGSFRTLGLKMNFQFFWGIILLATGIGVFFRIPVVIEKVRAIDQFAGGGIYFAYFCFYFIGTVLIGGGLKKIMYVRIPNGTENIK